MTIVPVGFAEKLPANRVMRTWVDGNELVVWRSASGKLSAWDNRCPHRGMRLSYGFVRGETLACIYHGWHYGVDGACKFIPAHPELDPPKTISNTSHFVMEESGVLWISTSGPSEPPKLLESLVPVRSINFECSVNSLIEALHENPITDENGIELSSLNAPRQEMILNYEATKSDYRVVLLIQVVSSNSANAYILCSKNWSASGKISISRWSDAVQRLTDSLSHGEVS